MDIQSRFVHALRTQAAKEPRLAGALPCPYLNQCQGRIFHNIDQLLGHARIDHKTDFEGLAAPEAHAKLIDAIKEIR